MSPLTTPSRRTFLKVMGASTGLAGALACSRPDEEILPYAQQPPDAPPGELVRYASALERDGWTRGVIVRCRDGRPIKVDGNPGHPASLGAAGILDEAMVLSLYDPDRARAARHGRAPADWDAFAAAVRPALGSNGDGVHLLLEPSASPTTARLLTQLRNHYPKLSPHWFAPLHAPALRAGTRPVTRHYDFTRAKVIVAVDADVLADGPMHLRYARQFSQVRRPGNGEMVRLFVAEPTPTPTGTLADHRLALRASEGVGLLAEILLALGLGAGVRDEVTRLAGDRRHGPWAAGVARDLGANRGMGAVVVGARQPPAAHALAWLIDDALGNVGRTTWLTTAVLPAIDEGSGIDTLVSAIQAGECRALITAGPNPLHSAPVDHRFAERFARVPLRATLGLHEDETGSASTWFVPMAHPLERWGDGRGYDGTASIIQPVIRPMYGGHSVDELLAMLAGDQAAPMDAVRQTWRARAGASPDDWWREVLEHGVIADTAEARVAASPPLEVIREAAASPPAPPALELVYRGDPRIHDGRYANNAWLQELPDPVTKLTWDNAALVSPRTAARLGVGDGHPLALTVEGRTLTAPALIVPGHADESIVLALGYGRTAALSVGQGVGVDGYTLRSAAAPWMVPCAAAPGAGPRHEFAITQSHWSIEGRDHVRAATLEQFRKRPDFTAEQRAPVPSLYSPVRSDAPEQWAMVIDLSLCTGCAACVLGCQAENNIPVVGAEGVRDSREMHWIRIDRYLDGDPQAPQALVEPMLCQQCEKAPCEYVCPVNATVHSSDGLNEMVYNRCVGTRFCSNNCPYKVRRFNWFNYESHIPEVEQLVHNPDVTVRERGVMEKCTFCVQRIRGAQIVAGREQRGLAPGEVRTACQEACPSEAIVFGSLTHPTPELAKALGDPRRFSVLHELGTRPRVQYLARISNPEPGTASA